MSGPQTSVGPTPPAAPGTAAATAAAQAAPGGGPTDPTHTGPIQTDLAIVTDGLTKQFRSGQRAVDGIALRVPRGSVYGFLGPNGSGKTTTIRMLLGLVRPTSGRAWLLGEPMPDASGSVLARVGALVEGPAFHPYLTARANLARLDASDATADPRTSRRRSDEALERVGLTAAANKPYRQYSLGMKQRLGLAAALLRPRELLVLDEPTNGLDPQGTREVRLLIRELADAGSTVLVSSHLLTEIDQVCTHLGIMGRGRLLAQGDRGAMIDRGAARVAVTTGPGQAAAAAAVLTGLGLTDITLDDPGIGALLGECAPAKVSAALVHAGLDLVGFDVRRPSLEELFVELTGEGFDVAR